MPAWVPCRRRAIDGEMSDAQKYEVRTLEQSTGRWVFRLVVVGDDDPSTWESDGKSYPTRQDAELAGRLAVAARLLRNR
jgi:hypothetical protein